MSNFNENPEDCWPNQQEQIVREECNDFSPGITQDSNGKRSYFGSGATKRSVDETIKWNERAILDEELSKRAISQNTGFVDTMPPNEQENYVPSTRAENEWDEIDEDFDPEENYESEISRIPTDQWDQMVGKAPSWSDIKEE